MRRTVAKIVLFAWIGTETVLFALTILLTVFGRWSGIVCQATTVLSFLFSVFLLVQKPKAERIMLSIAMTFTVAADVFLVLLDRYYEAAVTIFIGAQVFHFVRLIFVRKKWVVSLIVRVVLAALIILGLIVFRQLTYLTAVGAIYLSNLLMNSVDSGLGIRTDKRMILCLVGFLLFICCDVTVGMNGVGADFGIPAAVLRIAGKLTWIFYIPSQVLIVSSAASGVFTKERTNEST